MGGKEFNYGSKMPTDGNGLDEEWQMALEICSLEITVWRLAFARIIRTGKCATTEPPIKRHQAFAFRTSKYSTTTIIQIKHHQSFAFRTSKCTITTMHLYRILAVAICGSTNHNKQIKATDFCPGDRNSEENYVEENEAICDELARHYVQYGLKNPEGYFDSVMRKFNRFWIRVSTQRESITPLKLVVSWTLIAQLQPKRATTKVAGLYFVRNEKLGETFKV